MTARHVAGQTDVNLERGWVLVKERPPDVLFENVFSGVFARKHRCETAEPSFTRSSPRCAPVSEAGCPAGATCTTAPAPRARRAVLCGGAALPRETLTYKTVSVHVTSLWR